MLSALTFHSWSSTFSFCSLPPTETYNTWLASGLYFNTIHKPSLESPLSKKRYHFLCLAIKNKVFPILFEANLFKITVVFYAAAAAKSHQSCPTLCDPIDGSPPGSPVPGILQARTLEWVAISFSNA